VRVCKPLISLVSAGNASQHGIGERINSKLQEKLYLQAKLLVPIERIELPRLASLVDRFMRLSRCVRWNAIKASPTDYELCAELTIIFSFDLVMHDPPGFRIGSKCCEYSFTLDIGIGFTGRRRIPGNPVRRRFGMSA
jgi:hypothetical protein